MRRGEEALVLGAGSRRKQAHSEARRGSGSPWRRLARFAEFLTSAPPRAAYSCRSASIGSIIAARRAG